MYHRPYLSAAAFTPVLVAAGEEGIYRHTFRVRITRVALVPGVGGCTGARVPNTEPSAAHLLPKASEDSIIAVGIGTVSKQSDAFLDPRTKCQD